MRPADPSDLAPASGEDAARVDLGPAKYDLGRRLNAIVTLSRTWEEIAERAAALFVPPAGQALDAMAERLRQAIREAWGGKPTLETCRKLVLVTLGHDARLSPSPAEAFAHHADVTAEAVASVQERAGDLVPEEDWAPVGGGPDALREAVQAVAGSSMVQHALSTRDAAQDAKATVGVSLARIRALDAVITSGAAGDGWQDISTAPSNGEPVWVWGGAVTEPQRRQADGEWWRIQRDGGSRTVITHWRPDPVPPPPTPPSNRQVRP